MRIKNIVIVFVFTGAAIFFAMRFMKPSSEVKDVQREITVRLGSIGSSISVTGTVLPRNRLEVMPPVGGRIDSVAVKEGDIVKKGDVVAWMSSNERAALLDAAHGVDAASAANLKDAYKPITLVAPIDGQVIVSRMQPGQSLTTSTAAIVLSDVLIVRAQVDETDIGKITLGQNAVVTIDAYSSIKIEAKAEHIYYESQTVNNVTMYQVDLSVLNAPDFLRSGMNATVEFITEKKDNVLLLPVGAISNFKGKSFVTMRSDSGELARRDVVLGIASDKDVEVLSGVSENDVVVIQSKKYSLPKKDSSSNPFMPNRNRQPKKGG
jgi:macrolide-specific efflux system membrane fusion protein